MYAFPSFNYITQEGRENPQGMTLRDYFAAKAMHVLYQTAYQYEFTGESRTPEYVELMKELSLDAYGMADAMMEARNAAQ
jgi:hypothetical protein